MSIPSKYFLWSSLIQCFTEGEMNLEGGQFIHGKVNICAILAEMIFHRRKQELNWIVIGGVRWQEFTLHAAKYE
jgi:hypothetical protein